MNSRSLDLGLVVSFDAESFGEPGQRTFRLLATTPEGRVSLWLEKVQVVALGEAIDELLQRVRGGEAPRVPYVPGFMGEMDVRVGSLSIGYDPEIESFILEAADFVSAFDIEEIRLATTRTQLADVAEQIEAIVAASRPRCPLCGNALTGEPHFCPHQNGHAHATIGE